MGKTSKNIVRINESQFVSLTQNSVKRILKEYEGDNFDDNDVVDTDDWRLEEPGEDEVSSILSTVRERCESCGAIFKELGDNEFGVISRNGVSMDVVTLLKGLEKDRIIYNTGGEISENGPWHAKFRIIGALKESASFNNTMDKAEKNFNPHTLRGKIGRMINPTKAKKFDGVQQKAKDMSYYDINDASFLAHNHPDDDDAKEIKMKRKRSNKYRR